MHYWLRAVWTNETLSPPSVLGAQEISTQEFDLPHVPFDLRLGQNFTPQHEVPFQMPPPPGNGTWRLSFQLYTSPPPPVEPTQNFLETPLRRLHILIVAP